MIWLRSLIFNILFMTITAFCAVIAMALLPFHPRHIRRFIRGWARFIIWLLRIVCSNPLLPFFCLSGIMLAMAAHTFIFWLPIIISALLKGQALTATAAVAKASGAASGAKKSLQVIEGHEIDWMLHLSCVSVVSGLKAHQAWLGSALCMS